MAKLTPAQERVMKRLLKGDEDVMSQGSAVYINRERFCNIDTMIALERFGLVENHRRYCWRATAKAKAEAGK